MTEPLGGVGPAAIRPATEPTVTHRSDARRARLVRERAGAQLDQLLGVSPTGDIEIDYAATGLCLTWDERGAAA